MFDSREIEKYKSEKAPEGLMDRILADVKAPKKKARVIGGGAFVRSASAIAACFIMVMTLSFMLREDPSDFYIEVGGEKLDRAGESAMLGDIPMALGRQSENPIGIPFVIEAADTVTVTVENGELWTDDGEETKKCELPYEAKDGELLYLLADEAKTSYLTLAARGESVTYAVTHGEDPADTRIVFQK